MRGGLLPWMRTTLPAMLALAALCACEARPPAEPPPGPQAWTDKAPDDPGLAGGPRRTASTWTPNGFVLLGGPPSRADAAAPETTGSGFQLTAAATGADLALHSVVYADDTELAGAPRPVPPRAALATSADAVAAVAAPAPPAADAPIAAMVLSATPLPLTAHPASTAAGSEDDLGEPPPIDFGRAFAFALCLFAAGALWKWRDRLPGKSGRQRQVRVMPAE